MADVTAIEQGRGSPVNMLTLQIQALDATRLESLSIIFILTKCEPIYKLQSKEVYDVT